MRFRDITTRVPKGALNLLTNKAIKSKTAKPKKKENKYDYIPDTDASLNVEISKNYKGETLGVAGAMQKLPPAIQTFLGNASIKTVKAVAGASMFILDNGFTIKVKEVCNGKHNNQHVIIKQGKKIILDKYV